MASQPLNIDFCLYLRLSYYYLHGPSPSLVKISGQSGQYLSRSNFDVWSFYFSNSFLVSRIDPIPYGLSTLYCTLKTNIPINTLHFCKKSFRLLRNYCKNSVSHYLKPNVTIIIIVNKNIFKCTIICFVFLYYLYN